MVTYSLYDMVTRVNGGGIIPIGETNHDNKSYFRLKEIEDLLDCLIDDMLRVYECTGYEQSIHDARKEAIKWFRELKEFVNDLDLDDSGVK